MHINNIAHFVTIIFLTYNFRIDASSISLQFNDNAMTIFYLNAFVNTIQFLGEDDYVFPISWKRLYLFNWLSKQVRLNTTYRRNREPWLREMDYLYVSLIY